MRERKKRRGGVTSQYCVLIKYVLVVLIIHVNNYNVMQCVGVKLIVCEIMMDEHLPWSVFASGD